VIEQQAEAVINAPVPRARPRPPEPRREVAEKRPERRREVERPRQRERPRPERRQPAAPASSASRAAPDASQGQRSRPSVSPARWQSQVQARLNRFKRTPRGGGAGTVRVSFTITASGAASGIRLAGSSGNPVLDEAALSLVRRASPFPAPPEGGSVSMTVPIAYTR
jgi:protein TonB